ncbi:GNAT family N-acetyltransferase [Nocardia sp. NPDC050710]|uniref:GNAT family N-acetyltransferase n=1 Tax=Nocardia sp. NPDC050710 TaxID=3157220 RepID=UPI0033D071A7
MIWPLFLSRDRLDDGEVSLQQYSSTDAEDLFLALRDERVWEHIPRTVPEDFSMLDVDIVTSIAAGKRLTFTVRRAGVVVGRTSLIWDPSAPEGVEIGGTQFTPAVWGTGINTRAKALLIGEMFAQGAAWIRFRTDERNFRSAAAIRKLGATDLGVHQDNIIRRDGSTRRSRFFRLDSPAECVPAPQS